MVATSDFQSRGSVSESLCFNFETLPQFTQLYKYRYRHWWLCMNEQSSRSNCNLVESVPEKFSCCWNVCQCASFERFNRLESYLFRYVRINKNFSLHRDVAEASSANGGDPVWYISYIFIAFQQYLVICGSAVYFMCIELCVTWQQVRRVQRYTQA